MPLIQRNACGSGTLRMVPDERSSTGDSVVKLDDPVPGTPLTDQLKVDPLVPREGVFTASQHDRPEEQVALVHQARSKGLGCKISSAHREIVGCAILHPPNLFGIELPLEGCLTACYRCQGLREDDLVGRSPDIGEIGDPGRLVGDG